MTVAQEHQPGFEPQPTLEGNLLRLRPVEPADFEALFAAASDPLIWEQHPESDRYTREVFQDYFESALESGGAFVIIERKSERIVGSSRYHGFDAEKREVEIGWTFLERAFWGGIYNRELKSLMLDHAFHYVDRVLFIVGETNLRSRKAVEKIGGKFLKKTARPDRFGNLTSNVVFVLERSDWERSKS